MKIVSKKVRDLDSFTKYFMEKGFSVEQGVHSVLLDHSELATIRFKREGADAAVAVVHYISPYYRVEMMNISDENKYLEELLKIKHSGEKWSIPVNPVIMILIDENLLNIVEEYRDEYPINDGEKLVKHYKDKNPGYKSIPQTLLARVLEELGYY